MKRNPQNKTLFFDIEVSPNLAYVYGKWETNVIRFERYQYIMSFSYKWGNQEAIRTYALPDFPNWKVDKFDDSAISKKLWDLINSADIIVAHNLKGFDIKKANARFLVNRMDPPRPYKMIDTLSVARNKFGFVGNSLEDLGIQLGIGQKSDHTHGNLWYDCINDEPKAWRLLKNYNRQDVVLLEGIFDRMLPWIDPYPRVQMDNGHCPKCGSDKLKKDGFNYTQTSVHQRYACISCGNRQIRGEMVVSDR